MAVTAPVTVPVLQARPLSSADSSAYALIVDSLWSIPGMAQPSFVAANSAGLATMAPVSAAASSAAGLAAL
jgi:hypothetical protein